MNILPILDVDAYSDERSEFDTFKIHSNDISNESSSSKINNPNVSKVTEDEEDDSGDSDSEKPIYPISVGMTFKHWEELKQ
ncbi:hypothetical protein F8M41_000378 [Gigaspora margarita]|uniref:Uncharacterized protein n=1 Tax=Gigaspora margarita TaxID=4874 RepID=A0A8H4A9X9_GIGMA|nr:hypothetical protein F8M41_000378 [Gigaspora margarita]